MAEFSYKRGVYRPTTQDNSPEPQRKRARTEATEAEPGRHLLGKYIYIGKIYN